ncbi:hypothetical protein ACOSP7_007668 [Xanthoceras sorbifolium]
MQWPLELPDIYRASNRMVVVSLGAGPWDQLFCGGNLPAIAVGGLAAFAGGLLAILAIPRSSAQKPRALT